MIKLGNLLFVLSIIGILILIFLSQNQPTQTGIIQSIEQSSTIIIIHLENSSTNLILFEDVILNLKAGDVIEFQGQEEVYKNQTQIIVDKITKC